MAPWSDQDQEELSKIANADAGGLAATSGSLTYGIGEAERHFHSYESWFGAAASPSGETHVADRIAKDIGSFQLDAGNDTWGSWVQILGSSDTPARAGNVKFDFHKLFVTAVERAATVYFLQFAFGADGDTALAAGTYTEIVYRSGAAVQREAPVNIQTRRITAGTKVWARCLSYDQNTGTINFYVGIHEYEG